METPILYRPIVQEETPKRKLHLHLDESEYDELLQGRRKSDVRPLTDYYKSKCTYTYGGKLFLIPYCAICYHIGKWRDKLAVSVRVTDIKSDGRFIYFRLGDLL